MGVLLELSYVRTGPVEMAGHGQGTLVADRAAIRVPALWIERLRAAVESADLDLLLALTDELATVDGPAAGEIRRMVNRFDYPALLALLDASREANA
jgi:hypothetical protein